MLRPVKYWIRHCQILVGVRGREGGTQSSLNIAEIRTPAIFLAVQTLKGLLVPVR